MSMYSARCALTVSRLSRYALLTCAASVAALGLGIALGAPAAHADEEPDGLAGFADQVETLRDLARYGIGLEGEGESTGLADVADALSCYSAIVSEDLATAAFLPKGVMVGGELDADALLAMVLDVAEPPAGKTAADVVAELGEQAASRPVDARVTTADVARARAGEEVVGEHWRLAPLTADGQDLGGAFVVELEPGRTYAFEELPADATVVLLANDSPLADAPLDAAEAYEMMAEELTVDGESATWLVVEASGSCGLPAVYARHMSGSLVWYGTADGWSEAVFVLPEASEVAVGDVVVAQNIAGIVAPQAEVTLAAAGYGGVIARSAVYPSSISVAAAVVSADAPIEGSAGE